MDNNTPPLRIGNALFLPESELHYETCRASGPGGQHVNVTDSAVQLRFDALHCPYLPEEVRIRLLAIAGNRITNEGILIIRCDRFKSQKNNKFSARETLIALLMKAAHPTKERHKTRVPKASKELRLSAKRHTAQTKRLRHSPMNDDR